MTADPGAIIYSAPEAHTSQQSTKVVKEKLCVLPNLKIRSKRSCFDSYRVCDNFT